MQRLGTRGWRREAEFRLVGSLADITAKTGLGKGRQAVNAQCLKDRTPDGGRQALVSS